MSWHYYARPVAPKSPPKNIQRLTELAQPLYVRKSWKDIQEEERARAATKPSAKELPPVDPSKLERLTKLPKRYEEGSKRRADATQQPGQTKGYAHATPLPIKEPSERILELSRPTIVRQRYIPPEHKPIVYVTPPLASTLTPRSRSRSDGEDSSRGPLVSEPQRQPEELQPHERDQSAQQQQQHEGETAAEQSEGAAPEAVPARVEASGNEEATSRAEENPDTQATQEQGGADSNSAAEASTAAAAVNSQQQ